MAAPFPPAGNQTQHTERPVKIYAEQYVSGQPLPVHVVIDPIDPRTQQPLFADGLPRVYLPARVVVVHATEWIISSRFTGQPIEVISAEEFAERFGPAPLT